MTGVLLVIALFGLVGFVLYLPFLLWFRYRRKRSRAITLETRVTRFGVVFSAVEIGLLLAGFAAGRLAPLSLVGSLTRNLTGCVIWGVGFMLASRIASNAFARRGFVVWRRTVRLPVVDARTRKTPGAADERDHAIGATSTEEVRRLYARFGADVQTVQARLRGLRAPEPNPQVEALLDATSDWHRALDAAAPGVALEVRLLAGLLIFGGAETKAALVPDGAAAGDIPFFVAHGKAEPELRADWPPLEDQSGQVRLLNDPFTAMRTVVEALRVHFGFAEDAATAKMADIHRSGSVLLDLPSGSAQETCLRLNREWRSAGLALYCEPARRARA